MLQLIQDRVDIKIQRYPMMIRCFTLFLFALLFLSSHSQADGAKFAFSWYAGYCKSTNKSCSAEIVDRWDHQSFTIHGLWPSKKTKERYGSFNISIIKGDPKLYDQMMNYWPPQSRTEDPEYKLWEHEWKEHGHDYSNIIYRVQPKRFAGLSGTDLNNALQYAFYQDVIDLYLSFTGVQKYPYKNTVKKQFAELLKIQENQFTWSCYSGAIVREAKVCVEFTPTGFKTMTCKSLDNFQCAIKVDLWELIEWKQSSQKTVFNSLPETKAQKEEVGKEKVGEEAKGEEEATQEGL